MIDDMGRLKFVYLDLYLDHVGLRLGMLAPKAAVPSGDDQR